MLSAVEISGELGKLSQLPHTHKPHLLNSGGRGVNSTPKLSKPVKF